MKRNWEVLLIGGSSGIGKSYLARQLAEHYKVLLIEVDDIRIALQQVADREKYPDLFTFIDTKNFYNEFDGQTFVQKIIGVSEVVWKALSVLISKHAELNETVIIEGDSIVPDLLAEKNLSKVKALFLYDDLDSIKERQLKRNRLGQAAEKAEKNALFSYAYSQELKRQAEEKGFMTINASPIETLYDRAIALIDN